MIKKIYSSQALNVYQQYKKRVFITTESPERGQKFQQPDDHISTCTMHLFGFYVRTSSDWERRRNATLRESSRVGGDRFTTAKQCSQSSSDTRLPNMFRLSGRMPSSVDLLLASRNVPFRTDSGVADFCALDDRGAERLQGG